MRTSVAPVADQAEAVGHIHEGLSEVPKHLEADWTDPVIADWSAKIAEDAHVLT